MNVLFPEPVTPITRIASSLPDGCGDGSDSAASAYGVSTRRWGAVVLLDGFLSLESFETAELLDLTFFLLGDAWFINSSDS